MDYSLFDFLVLLGALGFFIYGMKIMSEGIQKAAGQKLREILGAMTKNRFFGVLTGFLITSLVQSSSATTVMTVSFVNAGLLSLMESAGVMMGANIGTTITGWIVAYLGFKFKIVSIALPMIAFGLPMTLLGSSKVKSWGEFIIGFALLFLGLNELKNAVPDLKENAEVLSFLSGFEPGILTNILFVFIGAIVTIIVQSSSAAMTLTFVMCHNGWIPFPLAAAMILGENIGTTITAELASVVGNVHAKRSARIHSMFNIIGVTWMVIVLPYAIEFITWFTTEIMGNANPNTDSSTIPFALSYFHTFFNLANVALLIWFVPVLVKFAIKSVKSKGEDDETFHLEYIGTGLMGTSELSVLEAKKEVAKFGEIIEKHINMVKELLISKDKKEINKLVKRIKKYEEITDRIESEVANYLMQVNSKQLSKDSTHMVRSMLSITNDLESIGDICFQMSINLNNKHNNKIWFTADQRTQLLDMFALVKKATTLTVSNLQNPYSQINLEESVRAELEIDKKRDKIKKLHLSNIEEGVYGFQNGLVYSDLFTALERIGDIEMNINEAISGRI